MYLALSSFKITIKEKYLYCEYEYECELLFNDAVTFFLCHMCLLYCEK